MLNFAAFNSPIMIMNQSSYNSFYTYDRSETLGLTDINTRADVKPYDVASITGRRPRWKSDLRRIAAATGCLGLVLMGAFVAKLAVERHNNNSSLSTAADPTAPTAEVTVKGHADREQPLRLVGDNTVRVKKRVSRREPHVAILLGDNPVGDSRTDLPAEPLEAEL